MSEAEARDQFEWKSQTFLVCKECGRKWKDKGTMLFHLIVGHQKIDEMLKPFLKIPKEEIDDNA